MKATRGNDDVRNRIAARAAKEVKDGMSLNLGIGIPNLLPSFLPPEIRFDIHSENGIMGVGHYPSEDEVDADLINAGKVRRCLFRKLSPSSLEPLTSPPRCPLILLEVPTSTSLPWERCR